MQTVDHISVTAKDGVTIPVITYNLEDDSKKGVVIVCHGFGEHSEAYIEHAERLWQGGYASVILDQRGHGKPPEGDKKWQGQIPDYQCFIDDIISVTEAVRQKTPGTPISIYGHSMGGNIVANTILRIPPEQSKWFSCAMLESPWFGLYDPVKPATRVFIKLMNRIAPRYRNIRNLNHEILTSDLERRKGYSKDKYYHGAISMRMITGVMQGCSYAMDNASKLPVKTYIAYASNELVVCNKAIQEFAAKAGDMVTAKEYESYHAIYNDVRREDYCRDLIAFMDSNIKQGS